VKRSSDGQWQFFARQPKVGLTGLAASQRTSKLHTEERKTSALHGLFVPKKSALPPLEACLEA